MMELTFDILNGGMWAVDVRGVKNGSFKFCFCANIFCIEVSYLSTFFVLIENQVMFLQCVTTFLFAYQEI